MEFLWAPHFCERHLKLKHSVKLEARLNVLLKVNKRFIVTCLHYEIKCKMFYSRPQRKLRFRWNALWNLIPNRFFKMSFFSFFFFAKSPRIQPGRLETQNRHTNKIRTIFVFKPIPNMLFQALTEYCKKWNKSHFQWRKPNS